MYSENPFQKPKSIAEKYQLWKQDLDRTCGNSLESLCARQFDRFELNRLNTRIRILERSLWVNPYQEIRDTLAKVKQERERLVEQMKQDIKKAKEYQPIKESSWKLPFQKPPKYTNPPGVIPILKHDSKEKLDVHRGDSKLSFADEAIEIVFTEEELNPVMKRVAAVHFD